MLIKSGFAGDEDGPRPVLQTRASLRSPRDRRLCHVFACSYLIRTHGCPGGRARRHAWHRGDNRVAL